MRVNKDYQPHWIREDFIDFIGEKINPLWSYRKVKARITAIEQIGTDFFQLQLRPNQNFKLDQYQAGQSVLVSVVIAGVRHQRSYSIVQIAPNGDVIIAIKRQGLVSTALTLLEPSAYIELSQTQGDFVLGEAAEKLLLIASGSGITAIYALLQQAVTRQDIMKIDVMYFSRDQAYLQQLNQISAQFPHVHIIAVNTLEQSQHLDLAWLEQCVPDFKQRQSYACGAHAMMQSISEIYAQFDISKQLKQEYFKKVGVENSEAQAVNFIRSQQSFAASSNLLESAELAGLRPAHGCRMGICNSCSCTKISGTTQNLLTGEIDQQANTQIKLCISQALSPVDINL